MPGESAARRRIVETATDLFYGVGVHAVGIDRIIAEAGVAKATFYKHFPSKDDLVVAYVEEQDRLGREAIARLPDRPPRETLLAIFDRYAKAGRKPGYRGCPFINAAAEYPDPKSEVRRAVDAHRRWLRELFSELLAAADHPSPITTAAILMIVADGVLVGAELDNPAILPELTRSAVLRLVDG